MAHPAPSSVPSIRQPLYLMSDSKVLEKIRGGRLSRLLGTDTTDAEIVDDFFLATLSRHPDAEESEFANTHIAETGDRAGALVDLVWALLNSREFANIH